MSGFTWGRGGWGGGRQTRIRENRSDGMLECRGLRGYSAALAQVMRSRRVGGVASIGETRFFPTRYTLKRNNEETHLLMAAMEPADAEMHDTGLQLAPIARHRRRAGHGAAHVGNFVCVRRARARQCYEADTNETFPDCRTRCKTRQPQKFSRVSQTA